jgi:hypothetical protein
MVSITIMTNGHLKITADNETRQWIKELQEKGRGSNDILHTITERYWTNGSYEPFDAGDANPFVGLSSAPCIAQEMAYDDNGKKEIVGEYWYFGNYMLEDPMETLKRTGRVIFQKA